MSVERCPKCNKIISSQERICSSCGEKIENPNIDRINDIYHKSNIGVLIYLLLFFIWAVLMAFFDWILATVVVVILLAILLYLKLKR